MSDKVCCQPYEVDYKKVVQEIQEAIYMKTEDLKKELKEETNPIRYIEIKAILDDVKQLRECIYHMFEYCKKPVEISNEKEVKVE